MNFVAGHSLKPCPFAASFLRGVVRLRRPRLDHDAGVATLVVLTLVGDCPDDVTTVQADGCAESRECCDQHRNDDLDNFQLVHSWLVCCVKKVKNRFLLSLRT